MNAPGHNEIGADASRAAARRLVDGSAEFLRCPAVGHAVAQHLHALKPGQL